MKINSKYIAVILMMFSVSIFAKQKKFETDVKNMATNILSFCKTNNFAKAAEFIAYHGNDKKRDNKDHYNYTVREEKLKVNRICRKIKSLELLSSSFEFEKIEIVKVKSVKHYSMKIKFKSGNQTIGIKFLFVNVKGKYLLSDID